MWLWKLQKHQSSVCALLQAQSVHYKQQCINPSKEKKNYCSVRFWFLSNSCPPDGESDKKSVFIFFPQLKADHTSKICRDCPRNCVKYSSITGSPWSGNDSAVNIFSSHLLMYKLFSVGIFSARIKHTVMSDCLCSKVITIGIMEHLSANNQKTFKCHVKFVGAIFTPCSRLHEYWDNLLFKSRRPMRDLIIRLHNVRVG